MFAKRAAVTGGVDIVATGQAPIVDLFAHIQNRESNVERIKAAEQSGIQSALAAGSFQTQEKQDSSSSSDSDHVNKKPKIQ